MRTLNKRQLYGCGDDLWQWADKREANLMAEFNGTRGNRRNSHGIARLLRWLRRDARPGGVVKF